LKDIQLYFASHKVNKLIEEYLSESSCFKRLTRTTTVQTQRSKTHDQELEQKLKYTGNVTEE
jgi:hypothetical protein